MKEAKFEFTFIFKNKHIFKEVSLVKLRTKIEPKGRKYEVRCLLNTPDVSQKSKKLVRNNLIDFFCAVEC